MSLYHKWMILISCYIKISFTLQTHNSTFTGKTYRIGQFRTGIQMYCRSICKDYGIFTPTRYNQLIGFNRLFFGTFFLMLCCNGWLIRQHSFLIFYLNAIYYYAYFFSMHINHAAIGQSQLCLLRSRLNQSFPFFFR